MGLKPIDYTLGLVKVATDFGMDHSFANAATKIELHHGIRLPVSAIRQITESCGNGALNFLESKQREEIPEGEGADCVIAEVDGSLVPMVQVDEQGSGDRRKTRAVFWKEVKVAMAYAHGSVTPKFGATFGNPDNAGDQLRQCAVDVGATQSSHIHALGDGAPWIADQIDRVFGSQASFHIDFFHVCEYLGAAAPCLSSEPRIWLEKQKKRLLDDKATIIIDELSFHLEPESIPDEKAPIRACHRYMKSRVTYLKYKQAKKRDLPIGSGEIESAHRYLIQKRLKIPGAWWKKQAAASIIALHLVRHNAHWDEFWASRPTKKAA